MQMVIISPDDLKTLITDAVRAARPLEATKLSKTRLNLKEAFLLLNEHGFDIAERYIYVLAQRGECPASKFGGRWSFNATELLEWAATRSKSNQNQDAIAAIAKSARKKSMASN